MIVRYRGWLVPRAPQRPAHHPSVDLRGPIARAAVSQNN
jgi:hypothetical protein